MKTVALVVGTRPERIKLDSVAIALSQFCRVVLVETGQHTTLLDSAAKEMFQGEVVRLEAPDPGSSMPSTLSQLVRGLSSTFESVRPHLVLVQGDTTSALAGALAASFGGFRVGHVEAGLRTHIPARPWPEEKIRKAIGQLVDLHFAPTEISVNNLLDEGIERESIRLTGNPGVDETIARIRNLSLDVRPPRDQQRIPSTGPILVTLHRREAHGNVRLLALENLGRFLSAHAQYRAIIVTHPNPSVIMDLSQSEIANHESVVLSDPLPHNDLLEVMNDAPFIISDSGGIQEEAPSLGKPVFIARDETERPEAVNLGLNFLVGANLAGLEHAFLEWQQSKVPIEISNPYGDGHAGERIAAHVQKILQEP